VESVLNEPVIIGYTMITLSLKGWKELITNCDKPHETTKYSAVTPFTFAEQIQLYAKIC
jgi:hypothetical protein